MTLFDPKPRHETPIERFCGGALGCGAKPGELCHTRSENVQPGEKPRVLRYFHAARGV